MPEEASTGRGPILFPHTLIASAQPMYEYLREPVLRRMPDGSLVCLGLTGGPKEPDNANVTVMTRSEDDGRSWSPLTPLFQHASRGVWTTEIFTGGTKPIAFVHTYNAETHYQEILASMSFGSRDGRTWSVPTSIRGGVKNVSIRQGLTLSDGSWIFPAYWQINETRWDGTRAVPGCGISGVWPFQCGVLLTSDAGRSFTLRGCLRSEYPLWEPAIALLPNGTLVLLMRADGSGCLYRSESSDGGLTWTDAAATNIPNPGTKIAIIAVPGGHVLFNNAVPYRPSEHFKDRTALEAWFSSDGFASVTKKTPISAPGVSLFYPHPLMEPEHGDVVLAVENSRHFWMTRIPLDCLVP